MDWPHAALDLIGLSPGQILIVTGAAGAVGGYAIQLALADGLHVIGISSASDEVLVRSLAPTGSGLRCRNGPYAPTTELPLTNHRKAGGRLSTTHTRGVPSYALPSGLGCLNTVGNFSRRALL